MVLILQLALHNTVYNYITVYTVHTYHCIVL